jgi:hypothetical protein
MANIQITQLPAAGAITGTEAVPIVQNGQTVQTTTGAISASPSQTQTFLTVGLQSSLSNSRYIGATNGLVTTDGGAQGLFNITTTGALSSLVSSSAGIQVKTNATTLINRSVAAGTTGLAVADGDGIAGNPTISLSGQMLNIANASFNGLVTLSTGGAITGSTITGTANQIDVANGTGVGGNPTVSITSNPTIPGTGGMVLPAGTTGQRGTTTDGNIRYNSTSAVFEGVKGGVWTAFATGSGVTSVATGTGLTGGPITSSGTISIDVTGVSAATYGSSLVVPVIAVNAQGQITSATNTTINAVTLTTGTISTTPSNSTDIANKSYVDTVAQGLDTKASVVAATTVNITLSGTQTVDGIALIAADRCLVKNQTLSQNNGIYDVAAGAWTRSTDMNTWAQVPGAYVFVETGTTQADTGWVCTSNAGGTLGTTPITWAQFSGAGSGVSSITFGTTGLTPSTATTGAVTVAGTLAVANGGTGLTAGTSGGIPAYTATGTITSSALLTQYGVVYGGGAGAVPVATAAGTTGQVLTATTSGAPTWAAPATSGTVTTVGFTGGIITVATPTTTPAFTVAGTSGGIVYFSSASTWATSAVLAASAIVIGGGSGVAPSTTTTGTGVVTALGVNTGSAGAFVVNGGALGTPSSGTVTNLTGTASININGTVGATSTTTGAFTTVAATTVTATTGIFGGTF